MKTITTAIAALLLTANANVQAESCESAFSTMMELHEDIGTALDAAKSADPVTPEHLMALRRRALSVKNALVSVRVYCHDNATTIKIANSIEDFADQVLRVGK